MTQKDGGNTDFNPKHRIVGAIIVVSLAVIFVPMVLSERTPPSGLKQIAAIPERVAAANPLETADTQVVVMPVTGSGSIDGKRPSQAPAATAAKPSPGDAERPAPSRHAPKTQTANVKAATVPPKATAKAGEGWVVQVGTFANFRNATRLREKLKSGGYSVNEERITLKGNRAVRLRVGPFHDKPAALRAQTKIKKDVGIEGVVLAAQ